MEKLGKVKLTLLKRITSVKKANELVGVRGSLAFLRGIVQEYVQRFLYKIIY